MQEENFEKKAIFFDVDGLLYDSLPAYVKAWTTAFRNVGIEFTEIDVYKEEGRPGTETVIYAYQKKVNREPTEIEINHILAIKNKILNQQPEGVLMHGAEKLIECAARFGKIYAVTGSTREGLKDRLVSDFGDYLPRDHIIAGRDYKRGKPNPEPYLLALERAKVKQESSIVVENAPLGIQSAISAGIKCVLAVNTGVLSDEVLLNAGASHVYKDCFSLARDWHKVI